MIGVTEDTVSRAVEAAHLFHDPDFSDNRRRRRSGEPARAVGYQFERVYDVVGADAIVLCDERGKKLSAVGDDQLCRMLSGSIPRIASGDRSQAAYSFKAMSLLRPGIGFQDLVVDAITVPKRRKQLYVASISESVFNHAGVEHATAGVRRILGISGGSKEGAVVTSRDRLAYDLGRALEIGYREFNQSGFAQELRIPKRFRPSRGVYVRALDRILGRVDQRLRREGLRCARPNLRDRFFGRDERVSEGYRHRRYQLPVRFEKSGSRWATLQIEMPIYERQFEIPRAPVARLEVSA